MRKINKQEFYSLLRPKSNIHKKSFLIMCDGKSSVVDNWFENNNEIYFHNQQITITLDESSMNNLHVNGFNLMVHDVKDRLVTIVIMESTAINVETVLETMK